MVHDANLLYLPHLTVNLRRCTVFHRVRGSRAPRDFRDSARRESNPKPALARGGTLPSVTSALSNRAECRKHSARVVFDHFFSAAVKRRGRKPPRWSPTNAPTGSTFVPR